MEEEYEELSAFVTELEEKLMEVNKNINILDTFVSNMEMMTNIVETQQKQLKYLLDRDLSRLNFEKNWQN